MQCRACGSTNDFDAAFCVQCGRPLAGDEEQSPLRQRKTYIYAMLLIIPVMIAAGAAAYYKFFLPEGVAAVVNGEAIMLSELDTAVGQVRRAHDGLSDAVSDDGAVAMIRYQVLNRMITERAAQQEAKKAGYRVSRADVAGAVQSQRLSMGLDEAAFGRAVTGRYGSMQAFEKKIERDLLIQKYIDERVVPPGASPERARVAASRWYDSISRGASVRIALAEQWTAADCSCCGHAPGSASHGDGKSAADAGIRYWWEKYGDGPVTARTTDYGCHIQVDIVKGNRIVRSLKYQGGAISEP